MKYTTKRKSLHLLYMWFCLFLLFSAAMISAQDNGKVKLTKSQLDDKYKGVAKDMQEHFEKKDKIRFDKVIDLFKKECCQDNGVDDKVKSKTRACKEKKEFNKASKEIRASIYGCVALSYIESNRPEIADIYLKKLRNTSKSKLNEIFKDVEQKIKEYFDDGKLNHVTDEYEKYCRKDGKSKACQEIKSFKKAPRDIRADIYQWIVLSYDALARTKLRDIYLKKLLAVRLNPGIGKRWRSIGNSIEENYIVAPRLMIGGKFGVNLTTVHSGNRYSIIEPATLTYSYHKDYIFSFTHSRGTQPGIIVEYAFTKNLSVSIQPTYIDLRFQYKSNLKRTGIDNSITLNYTHRQKLDYAEIPVLLKYHFLKGRLKPYLQIGLFYHRIMFANKTLRTDSLPEIPGFNEETEVNIKNLTNLYNWGPWVGVGIGYDTGPFQLGIELNYKHGFRNIVNEDHRYENQLLVFGYYDVFDDIKIRNWDLSLKVLLPISFKAFRK